MKVRERILVITDLLVAAVYCDGTMLGEEDEAARNLIADLLLISPEELPPEVDERIRNFKLIDFDLETAAKAFLEDPPMRKRRLLELVAKMVDADGVHDFLEDQFMRDLARHLGMEKEEYADLVVAIEEAESDDDRLRESYEMLASPPPIPEHLRKK